MDFQTALWLKKRLRLRKTVIVVSHDRHFLNKVCTHIADVDFRQVKIYPGNYDFGNNPVNYHVANMKKKIKADRKSKELEDFVHIFNKCIQIKTSDITKKINQQLSPEELPESRRRTPFIQFKPNRKCGNKIVEVKKTIT